MARFLSSLVVEEIRTREATRARFLGPFVAPVLQSSSSQKHMWPFVLPSVIQTWSTMKRLMSRLSVHVLRTDSATVPACRTNFTQQPSQGIKEGISPMLRVQLNGSRHPCQLLHSKQSIL